MCLLCGDVLAVPQMREFEIELPDHVLRFALPSRLADKVGSNQVRGKFDPSDPQFQKTGFYRMAGSLFDFGGAFLRQPKGSLRFDVFVRRRSANYSGDIQQPAILKEYLDTEIEVSDPGYGFDYRLVEIGESKWVQRSKNTIMTTAPNRADGQILSHAAGPDLIIEFGIRIMAWEQVKDHKWLREAEQAREAMKASLRLIPKVHPEGKLGPVRIGS